MEIYADGKIQGKLKQVFEPEVIKFGDGKEKSKITLIVGIGGDFPKDVIVDFWGQDKIQQKEGDNVEVYFNVKSRVFKEKVYHTLSGRAIRPAAETPSNESPANDDQSQSDDLPF